VARLRRDTGRAGPIFTGKGYPGGDYRYSGPGVEPTTYRPSESLSRGAPGERNSRVIPQDVKIQVSRRDDGRCVECGSQEDLHFDHKVPWSRGGSNTVNNIQLLCGRCNRKKGAR
jgi:hypothetical protein